MNVDVVPPPTNTSNRAPNYFDNMGVDVRKLYKEFPIEKKINPSPNLLHPQKSPFHFITNQTLLPLILRRAIQRYSRQINLDQSWFNEFHTYWSGVLKGRPLISTHDLWFLKNWYRVKFQDLEMAQNDNLDDHLDAWQKPEVVFQLLHYVCKESMRDHTRYVKALLKYKPEVKNWLEFGCGVAPITTSFFDFFSPSKSCQAIISDIQTLPFHFASHKFRHCSNVTPVMLKPEEGFLLKVDKKLDAVYCITVFEHLKNPLKVAKMFFDMLEPGGILVFDYIKSDDADNLDTIQGVKERNAVMDFISENFELLEGTADKGNTVELAVARVKKR